MIYKRIFTSLGTSHKRCATYELLAGVIAQYSYIVQRPDPDAESKMKSFGLEFDRGGGQTDREHKQVLSEFTSVVCLRIRTVSASKYAT